MLNGITPLVVAALLVVPLAPVPTPARPVRATITLVSNLAADARAVLIIRASGDGVILLRHHDASVTDLGAALAVLDRLRHAEPTPLARDRQVLVKSASIERALPEGARQRLTAQLARLRQAPPRDVPGVGVVPAIEVQLGQAPRL